jgi:hypothetical protein
MLSDEQPIALGIRSIENFDGCFFITFLRLFNVRLGLAGLLEIQKERF